MSQFAYCSDPTAKIFRQIRVVDKDAGMPTFRIIDRKGCELSYLARPAERVSGDALKPMNDASGQHQYG